MAPPDPPKTPVAKNAPQKTGSKQRPRRGNHQHGKAPASAAKDQAEWQSGGRQSGSRSRNLGKPALWFALTLVNIALLVLLIPDLVNNQTITNAVKIILIVATASSFKATLAWFRRVFNASPNRWWFKVAMVIGFFVLTFLNVSTRVPLIPLYPVIDPGVTLYLDGVVQSEYSGVILVKFEPHTLKVETPPDKGKPREYPLRYRNVFWAMFSKYNEHLSPFYTVDLKTRIPKIEVEILKTDGDFDSWFRTHYERSFLYPRTSFKCKCETNNTFIWQASDGVTGSADKLYLPHGQYTFTANKEGCKDKPITINISGVRDDGYLADFRSLCPLH